MVVGLSEEQITDGYQVDTKDSTVSEFGLTVVGRSYINREAS